MRTYISHAGIVKTILLGIYQQGAPPAVLFSPTKQCINNYISRWLHSFLGHSDWTYVEKLLKKGLYYSCK